MASFSMSDVASADCVDGAVDILNTNWQTTAAVGLSVASGGVAGAIMLSALPLQTLATGAGIGVLAYTGKRRADGLNAFPDMPFFSKKDDENADKPAVDETPVVTDRPAVATA